MGRKAKKRIHYMADANYLIRICEAIEEDERRSVEWRQEVLPHLRHVITMFSIDAQKVSLADTQDDIGVGEK
jgi:hypothetical protein